MTATVRITHYGHACVLAELPDGTRVLFDPGTYSAGFEDLTGLDAVLITHEHPDTMPPGPVRILLLPAGGPWMKLSESIDYLRAVAPEIAIPIHQAGLADIHRQLHYQLFSGLAPSGTTVRVLDPGTAAAL
jgi:L-ascorbate metabolism protein UlaG (beta-lactamase superfamily)